MLSPHKTELKKNIFQIEEKHANTYKNKDLKSELRTKLIEIKKDKFIVTMGSIEITMS